MRLMGFEEHNMMVLRDRYINPIWHKYYFLLYVCPTTL